MHIADLRKLLPDGYYLIHSSTDNASLTNKGGKEVYHTCTIDNPNGSYKVQHRLNGDIFEPDGMLWANVECYSGCTLQIVNGQLMILDDKVGVVFSARNHRI